MSLDNVPNLFQNEGMIKAFLDRTLKSRLGIRLLAEHHLALHSEKVGFLFLIKYLT